MIYIYRFGKKGKGRAYHKSINPKSRRTCLTTCQAPPSDLPLIAATYGQLQILQWLYENREEFQRPTQVMRRYRQDYCGPVLIWDYRALKAAITRGHWDTFRFLLSIHIPILPQVFEDCYCRKHNFSSHICLYILREYNPGWFQDEAPEWFRRTMLPS